MTCNCKYEIGTSSYQERWVDCYSYLGEDDNNFTKGCLYRDYSLFIGIINSCGSAKTSGLKYRREGRLYKLLGYEPQILIKDKWYNQKDFKALKLKESEFKEQQRHQTINNLLEELG